MRREKKNPPAGRPDMNERTKLKKTAGIHEQALMVVYRWQKTG